jgi:uncharacterized protein (DUF58 family)
MFKFLRSKSAAAAAPAEAVRAAPAAVVRPDVDQVLRHLEWTVLRRLDGVLQGDTRTLMRGFGLDLADLREYQAHDDVRHIDWNVTARQQTPYVREFQEDRDLTAWFVIDLTGSVEFGSQGRSKAALAEEFVGIMARLMVQSGNRVGALLLTDGDVTTVAARTGRMHVLNLMQTMRAVRERRAGVSAGTGAGSNAPPQETNLTPLIQAAAQRFKRRGAVFLVSDFISQPGWGAALGPLAQRHEVVAVRLLDPMEQTLPNLGLVVLKDAETGEDLLVDTRDKRFRARFEAVAKQREAMLDQEFAKSGVDCFTLHTDAKLDRALLAFAQQRKRRRFGVNPGLRSAA